MEAVLFSFMLYNTLSIKLKLEKKLKTTSKYGYLWGHWKVE